MVTITVDDKIRIPLKSLPQHVSDNIVDALTIPNQKRIEAEEKGDPGWADMQSTFMMFNANSGDLVMPRGFAWDLLPGLEELGIQYETKDNRRYGHVSPIGKEIKLHPWQVEAQNEILRSQEGIWKAPAGSGKTVGILSVIRSLSCRALVIVNTKDILYQWEARAKQFLGEDYPVAIIGDGRGVDPGSHLTIATVQTLHRNLSTLRARRFFDIFSFVCLDECHHATADTFNKVINLFSARYRIGVSATPDKTGEFKLATLVLGPIIHETKDKDVTNLINPKVFKVPTGFKFPYRPQNGRIPSNYQKMIKALVEDEERNAMIAKAIIMEDGMHSLVISKRLDHLFRLREMIKDEYRGLILMLTGKESSEDRKKVIQIAARESSVIFSTLADEALDIPRLDTMFLIYPQKNAGLIVQQVGRVKRKHDDKRAAHIYDFCDLEVGVLQGQWLKRRRQVYEPAGYEIEIIRPGEIDRYYGEFDAG